MSGGQSSPPPHENTESLRDVVGNALPAAVQTISVLSKPTDTAPIDSLTLILRYSHDGDDSTPAYRPSLFRFIRHVEPSLLTDGDLRLVYDRLPENFDGTRLVPAYSFTLCVITSEGGRSLTAIGHVNIRLGAGPKDELLLWGGQIGYAVDDIKYRGRKYASRGVRLIIPLIREHHPEFESLSITTSPDNEASKRTAVLCGAKFAGDFALPRDTRLAQQHPEVTTISRFVLPLTA